MAFEEALVARLQAAAAVAAIAGSRVSWFERPRIGGLPCVELTEIAPGEEWTHSGPDGVNRALVQFDAWAETATIAMQLARAVKTEMQRLPTVTAAGWVFHPAALEMRRHEVDDIDGGTKVYRVQQDFSFYHEEE